MADERRMKGGGECSASTNILPHIFVTPLLAYCIINTHNTTHNTETHLYCIVPTETEIEREQSLGMVRERERDNGTTDTVFSTAILSLSLPPHCLHVCAFVVCLHRCTHTYMYACSCGCMRCVRVCFSFALQSTFLLFPHFFGPIFSGEGMGRFSAMVVIMVC